MKTKELPKGWKLVKMNEENFEKNKILKNYFFKVLFYIIKNN